MDFYHPGLPQAPIRQNAILLPYRTIRQLFEETLESTRAHFVFLKELLDRPLIQCQPPPPIPSEAYLRDHPGVFRDEIARSGIAPKPFRLKMWKAQCDVMQSLCDEIGIGFLPCPQAALDEEGYLAEAFWGGRDPTHASADYGALVLRQLAEAIRTKRSTSDPVPK